MSNDKLCALHRALLAVNAVAIERGDKFGVCDQIDNTGQPYQSQWLADLIATTPAALAAQAQEASQPSVNLTDEQKTELLDWVSACQSAYHIESTPGHRFGGLTGNLGENRASLVEYVNQLLSRAQPAAPARDDIRDALKELVECKDLKDTIYQVTTTQQQAELHDEHERREPAAWAAARAALSRTPPAAPAALAEHSNHMKRDAAQFADALQDGWIPFHPSDTRALVEVLRSIAAPSATQAAPTAPQPPVSRLQDE